MKEDSRRHPLNAYPLCWPDKWQRTKPGSRKNGQFKKKEFVSSSASSAGGYDRMKHLNVQDACNRIFSNLVSMGIKRDDTLISTNLLLRLDGLPRGDQGEPGDPGAAVYWRKGQNGPMRCMAIDLYSRVADNLAAIAATLEAMRAIERHGGAEILDRAFTGFAALPQTSQRHWGEVLGVAGDRITREMIEGQFRSLARVRHPDTGGSDAAMAELNVAREQALKEIA